ncbi:MAG: hypothetical protein ACREGA_00165 [Candidatus Saccharimonadales bacterium]
MKTKDLTPRQNAYMQAYVSPDSPSFGNSYQSARTAGYRDQTARNLMHLNPEWLSDNIGQIVAIQPDELITELATIIKDGSEPTIIRLRAIELNLKAYGMLSQRQEAAQTAVTLNIDLTS